MTLVGYVSDEWYMALPDVLLEFERGGQSVASVRTTATGAVRADLASGSYRVSLAKSGYGSKVVEIDLLASDPYQFRLLSDRTLGYMWPRWARGGGRSDLRVHSVEPFRASLWRYGSTKEFVRLLGWFDGHGPRAVMQITPDGDYTQTGVNWNQVGYGHPHDHERFPIEAPDQSGLYYIHIQSESGAFFSFPWVVAPRHPMARMAVVANTNTWNAYNSFGGRGNYVNSDRLPNRPIVNTRQEVERYQPGKHSWLASDDEYQPLSLERPEIENNIPLDHDVDGPIPGRRGLASYEWRLLAWLEREGLDYDYYSEYQLHAGDLDLDAYRVVVLPVHPEYWSREMYQRMKDWVFDRGGRLIYLGGNGLNCEIEVLDEGTVRFKTHRPAESGLGSTDPDDPTLYYESRFHRTHECEANLLGVVCTDSGMMTAAPYRVIDADHWAFDGTNLAVGELFGTTSQEERCSGGASGRETDKRSKFSPPGTHLLAKGANPDDGGAEMVVFGTGQGGGVFSVGSITYVSSLLVDRDVSMVTRNVFNRFLADESAI